MLNWHTRDPIATVPPKHPGKDEEDDTDLSAYDGLDNNGGD